MNYREKLTKLHEALLPGGPMTPGVNDLAANPKNADNPGEKPKRAGGTRK